MSRGVAVVMVDVLWGIVTCRDICMYHHPLVCVCVWVGVGVGVGGGYMYGVMCVQQMT